MSKTVVDLTEADPRPFVVQTVVLTERTPCGSVTLRRGEELFVAAEGQPIIRPGCAGPDEVYCIGPDIGGGKWPVLLFRVQRRHADKWVGLDAAHADRFIAHARRRLAEIQQPAA